jgi:hypothetical protein
LFVSLFLLAWWWKAAYRMHYEFKLVCLFVCLFVGMFKLKSSIPHALRAQLVCFFTAV